MANIHRQRDIIDRRALVDELAQTVAASRSPLDRSALLPPLKEALAKGRAEIQRRFESEGHAPRAVRERAEAGGRDHIGHRGRDRRGVHRVVAGDYRVQLRGIGDRAG